MIWQHVVVAHHSLNLFACPRGTSHAYIEHFKPSDRLRAYRVTPVINIIVTVMQLLYEVQHYN